MKRRKVFRFKPSINVIWGPNGIGKSTLITALARMTHSEQGGRSVVTSNSIGPFFPIGEKALEGFRLDFDGQPVRMFDPSKTIGLYYGAFDDDFFSEGFENLRLRKASSGQGTVAKFNKALVPVEKVEGKMVREAVNSLWQKRLDFIERHWKATIPVGPPTILMDEPDAMLDWPTKETFWRSMEKGSAQVIVATHSLFALDFPKANIIPLGPKNYVEDCRGIARRLLKEPKE